MLALAAAVGMVALWPHAQLRRASASPTTTVAAPRVQRLVLIGDSVMGEVAAAVTAATAGEVTVDYVLTIGTANVTDDWWGVWRPLVERDRPDAVAVLVGPWEINRPDLGTPAWAAWYGARLDAWAQLLTAGGARLYWLTPAPVRDATAEPRLEVVTDAFAALARRRPDTVLVDTAAALGSPSYREREPGGARLRRVDGLHLCPAGAARVADALLAALHVPPVPGWRGGHWATAAPAYSAAECPA